MSTVEPLARAARAASRALAQSPEASRNAVLVSAAQVLRSMVSVILKANEADLAAAEELDRSAKARLRLTEAKIEQMAVSLETTAELPDPLGRVNMRRELDEDLLLTRIGVPIGVLGVVFESRPDVAIQIGGLAIKSGNAVLLKGGSEARRTVAVLVDILRDCLEIHALPVDTITSLTERSEVHELLNLPGLVDLIIPRGSQQLVQSIQQRTHIPVLGHADGVCHMYVDASADPKMTVELVRDAKLQYPAACNAIETLLIHAHAAPRILPLIAQDLLERGVELRGDGAAAELIPVVPATDDDWDAEYLEPILAVRVVGDIDEALEHIAAHGSGHTEVIVTSDKAAANRFQMEVDAAGVYVNASSRFADGYRYGFGAEVGISTSRIHARGPVGLEGLVTTKYLLRGSGHVVADYAEGKRQFTHRDLT